VAHELIGDKGREKGMMGVEWSEEPEECLPLPKVLRGKGVEGEKGLKESTQLQSKSSEDGNVKFLTEKALANAGSQSRTSFIMSSFTPKMKQGKSPSLLKKLSTPDLFRNKSKHAALPHVPVPSNLRLMNSETPGKLLLPTLGTTNTGVGMGGTPAGLSMRQISQEERAVDEILFRAKRRISYYERGYEETRQTSSLLDSWLSSVVLSPSPYQPYYTLNVLFAVKQSEGSYDSADTTTHNTSIPYSSHLTHAIPSSSRRISSRMSTLHRRRKKLIPTVMLPERALPSIPSVKAYGDLATLNRMCKLLPWEDRTVLKGVLERCGGEEMKAVQLYLVENRKKSSDDRGGEEWEEEGGERKV